MKLRRISVVICSLLMSLFVSFTLILFSIINDENEMLETWKFGKKSEVKDTKSLLLTPWNEAEEEELCRKFIKLYSINPHTTSDVSPWVVAREWVTSTEIHPDSTMELGFILNSMSKRKITWAGVGHKGTQLKMTIVLEGGQYAIFKPKWYSTDTIIEGQPYDGHDRHNGEIVAFHLNRVLGFRRAPLVVGRVIDLEEEIIPYASRKLKQSFFVRNGTDICFLGQCLYCKTEKDAACGEGKKMEGAVVLWLPRTYTFDQFRHPWSRSYNMQRKAKWELTNTGESYCGTVRQMPLYRSGSLLLDIIDSCIFDFLIGNADRHHFEIFTNHTNPMMLLIDNAKSFGNPHQDEKSILSPLLHCKFIRTKTAERLNQLKNSILSRVLKAVLSSDPISPLITDAHIIAMSRRLDIVINILSSRDYSFL